MTDGQVQYLEWDPGAPFPLGRHIRHDPRSRQFAAPRRAVPTTDKRHHVYGRRLYQGDVGACTGFAAAHALNALPYRLWRRPEPTFTNADALDFYSGATKRDVWDGAWPPDDTGSSGLAVAQELQARQLCGGYRWAFGFDHGLSVIGEAPLLQGSWWEWNMFRPDSRGLVRLGGGDAGGHEYLWIGVEIRSKLRPSTNWSWFRNSWHTTGDPWGVRGNFAMTWADHEALLNRDGDLIRLLAP